MLGRQRCEHVANCSRLLVSFIYISEFTEIETRTFQDTLYVHKLVLNVLVRKAFSVWAYNICCTGNSERYNCYESACTFVRFRLPFSIFELDNLVDWGKIINIIHFKHNNPFCTALHIKL